MNHHDASPAFKPARVGVLTVSDTRTEADDKSGGLIRQRLLDAGHQVVHYKILLDDLDTIRAYVLDLVRGDQTDILILTGGTGLASRDQTPDAIAPLYRKHIPGFGELFRHLSFSEIGTSTIQSRADAGLCEQTLVFCLPGSTGACRLAMDAIILPQIDNRHKPCNFRDVLGR